MNYEAPLILPELEQLAEPVSLVVALSGGLDSMVLLESVTRLRDAGLLKRPLRALHVHHGLSPAADHWLEFCAEQCARRNIHYEHARVSLDQRDGESLEALARKARYRVFSDTLGTNQCLLLGHHQDDQMEQLLLRLSRGSGPGGLSGMPKSRILGAGSLLRPLLGFPRRQLRQFAETAGLQWIEDESNASLRFDRNFWRREILPRIEQRFPGYRDSWQKSMALCAEAELLGEQLAGQDLALTASEEPRILNLAPLLKLSPARQRNLLRHWMLRAGFTPPGWQTMHRLSDEILPGSSPAARLDCADGAVQRFGAQLVLMGPAAKLETRSCQWDPRRDPQLSLAGNGSLTSSLYNAGGQRPEQRAGGLLLRVPEGSLTVAYRSGGEPVRLAGRGCKPLRKVLQESNLPAWLRARQPLLFQQDRLVCIPGIGIADGYLAAPGEQALSVSWQAPDLLFHRPSRD
ncbi:MAG: tRNA lysidine(34) synthetase TilS [Gammaproteobacteria bacterium]|nr:tRNA lysidine(34) synthetase TilS [Pseudomonadales bacterium]MCP5346407.1 tRNA lysidine(34) synthetase TilS [Pseudomonadales bacterium]